MQIRRESEREVRQDSPGGGGVEVASGRTAGNESVEKTNRNRGHETQQEAENGDRYSDRRRHGIHLRQLHDWGAGGENEERKPPRKLPICSVGISGYRKCVMYRRRQSQFENFGFSRERERIYRREKENKKNEEEEEEEESG